jgi:hypothetical protein
MDNADDGRGEHIGDNSSKLSRHPAGVCDDDGFITPLKNQGETITSRDCA